MAKKKVAVILTSSCDWAYCRQLTRLAKECDLSVITSKSVFSTLAMALASGQLKGQQVLDYKSEPSYLPGLESILDNFDLVILTDRRSMASYQAARARAKSGYRLVVIEDNIKGCGHDDRSQSMVIRQELAKAVDEYWVHCKGAVTMLEAEGEDLAKVHRLRPVVADIGSGVADGEERVGARSRIVLGYFGRMTWQSGLFDLVNAIKVAHERYPVVKQSLSLLLCAQGEQLAFLGKRVDNLGLSQAVSFADPYGAHADRAFMGCDAVFYSPLEGSDLLVESAPLLLQAMRSKKPVISFRTPMTEEYLGKHRIDFTRGSLNSLAKALYKLCTAKPLLTDIVQKNFAKLDHIQQVSDIATRMKYLLMGDRKAASTSTSVDEQIESAEQKIAQKDYYNAIELLEALFAHNELRVSQRAKLLCLLGDCFTRLGDYEQALGAYAKSVELDPFGARSFVGLGTANLLLKRPELAVVQFQKALALAPDAVHANQGLGLAFQSLNQPQEALKWMEIAQKLEPLNPGIIYCIVLLSHKLDRYNVAERVLREYLQRCPHNQDFRFSLAGILAKLGRYHESGQLVGEILKHDPGHIRALALRAKILPFLQGQSRESIA